MGQTQSSEPFGDSLYKTLINAPLTPKQRATVWDAFYSDSTPNEDFASQLSSYGLSKQDQQRIYGWRVGLFGGPGTVGVLEQEAQKEAPPSTPQTWLDTLTEGAKSYWRNIEQPKIEGAMSALEGVGSLAADVAKSAIGWEELQKSASPDPNVSAPAMAELLNPLGVVKRPLRTLYNKLQLEPATQLFEKAATAEKAGNVPARVAYNLSGLAALVPGYGMVAPIPAAIAESGVESYEQGTPAPLMRTGAELATGAVLAKGVPAGMRTANAARAAFREAGDTVGIVEKFRANKMPPGDLFMSAVGAPKNVPPLKASQSASQAVSDMKAALPDLSDIAPNGMKRASRAVGAKRIDPVSGEEIPATAAETLLDSIELATRASQKKWDTVEQLRANGAVVPSVSAADLANSVRRRSPKSKIMDAEHVQTAQAIEDLAQAIEKAPGGVLELPDITNAMQEVNARSNKFFRQTPEQQGVARRAMGVDDTVNRIFKEALDENYEQLFTKDVAPEVRKLQRDYGNINDYKRNITARWLSAVRQSEYELGNMFADTSLIRSAFGAGRSILFKQDFIGAAAQLAEAGAIKQYVGAIKEMNSSAYKIKKAIELATPTAPFNVASAVQQTVATRLQRPALPERTETAQLEAAAQEIQRIGSELEKLKQDAQYVRESKLEFPGSRDFMTRAIADKQAEYQRAIESRDRLESSLRGGAEVVTPVIMAPPPGRELAFDLTRTVMPERTPRPAPNVIDVEPVKPLPMQPSSEELARLSEQQAKLAREAEIEAARNAALDESMFREIAQRGRGAVTEEMGGAQRGFEREQALAARQQEAEAKAAASASRTQAMLEQQQRVEQAQQQLADAQRRLDEARLAERRALADTRKKAKQPDKKPKAEKPLTEAQKAAQTARMARERAAEEARVAREAVAAARKAPAKTETAPSGKVLMWLGQPIELIGEPVGRYQQFRFVGGRNRGKTGWKEVQ